MDVTALPLIPLLLLVLSWTAYFALHSWLASLRLKESVDRLWPGLSARYRLIYNLLAIGLLIPPVWLLFIIESPMLWQWQGYWRWLSHVLLLSSLIGFWFTTRYYDMPAFLGLTRATATHFSLSPLHRYVRHPWYFLGLILVWSRDMDLARFIVVTLATAYLWYGSRLEDRKLVAEFGTLYRSYMERVPGLLPRPGKSINREEITQLLSGNPLT